MWHDVEARLGDALRRSGGVRALAPELEARVADGSLSPTTAARRLVDAFWAETRGAPD